MTERYRIKNPDIREAFERESRRLEDRNYLERARTELDRIGIAHQRVREDRREANAAAERESLGEGIPPGARTIMEWGKKCRLEGMDPGNVVTDSSGDVKEFRAECPVCHRPGRTMQVAVGRERPALVRCFGCESHWKTLTRAVWGD